MRKLSLSKYNRYLTVMKINKEVRRKIRRKKDGICKFLYDKLNDTNFHLAQWTNRSKGEFCLHWLHASSGSWSQNADSELFRLWALHKGKLGENAINNYKTWKANFRCAMKSRFELEEIKMVHSKHKKKDVKFWRFTDLSFINEQPHNVKNQTTDDDESKNYYFQIKETTRNENSKKNVKTRQKQVVIHYNDIDQYESEESIPIPHCNRDDNDLTQPPSEMNESKFMDVLDNNDLEVSSNEVSENKFMDILEGDESAKEELLKSQSHYYNQIYPVYIEELNMNSYSEMNSFHTPNQIVPNAMSMYEIDSIVRGLDETIFDNETIKFPSVIFENMVNQSVESI